MSHATIYRGWDLDAPHPRAEEWERIVREASRVGTVRAWDDGRGRWMWYDARRGTAERALYLACCEVLGIHATEVRV